MAFDLFTTKRVSCVGQDNRIDDLITCKLSGDKCAVFRQFLVDEFHSSAVFKCFDPLFVWHFRISSAEIRVCRELSRVYVVRCQKSPDGKCKASLSGSGIRTVHAEPQRRRDLAASLCPNEQFLNRLTETEGEKCSELPLCGLHAPNNKPELPH